MGHTVKLLAERTLPARNPETGQILVDICENIHIHTRELRQEMSLAEFREQIAILNRAAIDVERYLASNPDYREDAVRDTLHVARPTPHLIEASPAPHVSAYYPDRLRIELERPTYWGEVHVHYRDLRLHLTLDEFRALAAAFREAETALADYLATNAYRPRRKRTAHDVAESVRRKQ